MKTTSNKSSFLILILIFLPFLNVKAQTATHLSIGLKTGYAPLLQYGDDQTNGLTYGIFGDLQVNRIIGRLSYTGVAASTVPNQHFRSGNIFHGGVGYSFTINDKVDLPVLISGGAALITYNNGYGSWSGNKIWDANPQVGLLVAPCYKVTEKIAVQLNLRYLKGFTVDNRSEEINVGDVSIGLRFTL
ncbi:outer membrane beta-barrel protein [Jiulongibacter sediminis]|uniref:Uncharacterized protein n=1 Tax=Jiulongibacter sediminis TaxID=1605367 RepID=A0A0P7BRS0_9BACT|nr:outer membrane beta-barrel protein [Jiulongibacter sediminis]KPM50043.1 hypothetical protein AFM12_05725 [Jiulongibacter sediminis]TBX27069.1 hypothetical protein TK44_05730 [Jiulongibacter sediminis]